MGVLAPLRVVIENVAPEVDAGRFPAKRVSGEFVDVEVDVFADGHDSVSGDLLYRAPNQQTWHRVPLRPLVNDRFTAHFQVAELGRYTYTVEAWADPFATWRKDALAMGFRHVESGPLVRSSYHAWEHVK